MTDTRDITGKNRRFTGTNSIQLPNGTTAQRVGSLAGEIRFNTTLNLAEYYTGTEWKAIDAPPVVASVAVDGRTATNTLNSQYVNTNGGSTVDIVIAGTGFDASNASVSIIGVGGNVTPDSTTINSSSQITVTCTRADFSESNDPYTVRVTNPSNLFAEISDVIDAKALPVFATASGSLGTVFQFITNPSLSSAAATDADDDTITYSISSGSLPSGLSINSSTGAITGTTDTIETANFTVSAATSTGTVTRDFSIQVTANPYVIATGGTVTEDGDFKVHTFTSPGTFAVSNAGGPTGSNSVEYLIVAGGASGGRGCAAGGGGAGGYRTNFPAPGPTGGQPVSATSYPVSVGGGGAALGDGNPGDQVGGNGGGSSSVFSISSAGGGGGGGNSSNPPTGIPGGSGGGGGHGNAPGGSGNQPPVSPPQGQPGGQSTPQGVTGDDQGGGGGGASQAGLGAPMVGGAGSPNSITGSAVTYAGGGGGATRDIPNVGPGGAGGAGGGGFGGRGNNGPQQFAPARGQPGTAARGGGGGGGCRIGPYPGPPGVSGSGGGGDGVVIIRYKYQ